METQIEIVFGTALITFQTLIFLTQKKNSINNNFNSFAKQQKIQNLLDQFVSFQMVVFKHKNNFEF